MSDDLRYEDDLIEQLNNLPFPDEDGAWEDMKKLLDEKGSKKAAPPPYLNYKIWGSILAIALLIIILCLCLSRPKTTVHKEKNGITDHNGQPAINEEKKGKNATDTVTIVNSALTNVARDSANTLNSGTPTSKDSSELQHEKSNPGNETKTDDKKLEPADEARDNIQKKNGKIGNPIKNQPVIVRRTVKPGVDNGKQPITTSGRKREGQTLSKNPAPATGKPGYRPIERGEKQTDTTAQNNPIGDAKTSFGNAANKPAGVIENSAIPADKANKPTVNTTVEPKLDIQLANSESKKESEKNDTAANKTAQPPAPVNYPAKAAALKSPDAKKNFHISIGIAEQQAVRLDCHCAYPDNVYTNTTAVKDYIPAVYVRLYPAKKWFMQAGLKIAAPQYVEEQLYKANVQNLPLNYTTTSYVLKKLYYTQIPVNFNYIILRGWSAGIGVMYNGLSQGISEVNVHKKIFGSASDSLVSSQIITGRNDSNFAAIVKNNFQGFIESEYRWRYLSFGARYAYSLQPYVHYADPFTGKLVEKKTSAFNFFIRVELWDSKKKKK